ncbi:helix-turn-helix domain-containing protein [Clostridium sp. MCC353]|uniref:IclR family transcriptional regulator n=1 Tax=Clostridium sp. MCC353 TaxID=2592646 RepID=UPI001C013593|nr:IclR family transcriptional regulator [Clostridium sp. MCC353]MBT9780058.1 helix-turn-helix domain-containing protein [Clostridium sp. MCC353]
MNRTVERTFAILQLIADCKEGITLQEIANEMGMAKSSAFVIVQTLLELNYISTVKNNNKKYCLGIETYSLGMKYVNDMSLIEQCGVYIPPIAEKYNKTAFVAVLNGTKIVYVYKYVAQNAKLASCALGTRKDAYATSLGKAIIAFLPEEERTALVDKIEFKALTNYTITSKERFLEEIERTKMRGYSLDVRELEDITSCCGAPIFNYNGEVIAAVSLSDIYNENLDDEKVAEDLKEAALQISRNLGYFQKP